MTALDWYDLNGIAPMVDPARRLICLMCCTDSPIISRRARVVVVGHRRSDLRRISAHAWFDAGDREDEARATVGCIYRIRDAA